MCLCFQAVPSILLSANKARRMRPSRVPHHRVKGGNSSWIMRLRFHLGVIATATVIAMYVLIAWEQNRKLTATDNIQTGLGVLHFHNRIGETVGTETELPEVCRKYFDPNFPINMTRAINLQIGQLEHEHILYTKEEIMKPLCDEEHKYATVFLLHNNALYVHKSTPTYLVKKRYRIENIVNVFQQQRLQFPSNGLPDLLFKWWSIDNPTAPCRPRNEEGPQNVVGTVGYSRCPPPYCKTSIVVPVSGHMNEAKEGRLNLTSTIQRLERCTRQPFALRPAHAEWHGISSGHVPMPFFRAPSELCSFSSLNCDDYDSSNTEHQQPYRKQFVVMFQNSSLPVNATFDKRDLCSILSENRLLYSVAGYSYSSNFYDNMLSGAVTIKQDYAAWSYFEPFFEANKHYILGKRDLSDVKTITKDILELSHTHPAFDNLCNMAQLARERAILFGKESPLLQNCFYNQLFRQYSKMLEPNATMFAEDEWVRLTREGDFKVMWEPKPVDYNKSNMRKRKARLMRSRRSSTN
jgi:hypothetical protein